MVNTKEQKRIMESQELIRDAMGESVGIYMAKEPKIADQWRDQSVWQLIKHLSHELEEIKRSGSHDRMYHNALDACGLSAILASKIRLESKRLREKDE